MPWDTSTKPWIFFVDEIDLQDLNYFSVAKVASAGPQIFLRRWSQPSNDLNYFSDAKEASTRSWIFSVDKVSPERTLIIFSWLRRLQQGRKFFSIAKVDPAGLWISTVPWDTSTKPRIFFVDEVDPERTWIIFLWLRRLQQSRKFFSIAKVDPAGLWIFTVPWDTLTKPWTFFVDEVHPAKTLIIFMWLRRLQ